MNYCCCFVIVLLFRWITPSPHKPTNTTNKFDSIIFKTNSNNSDKAFNPIYFYL